jgi:hypothetical protein
VEDILPAEATMPDLGSDWLSNLNKSIERTKTDPEFAAWLFKGLPPPPASIEREFSNEVRDRLKKQQTEINAKRSATRSD